MEQNYNNTQGYSNVQNMNAPNKQGSSKTIWIVIIILGLVLIVLGVMLLRAFGEKKTSLTEDISREFDASQITKLELEVGISSFKVEKISGEKIKVEAHGVPEGRYNMTVDGEELKLEYKEKASWFNLFGNNIKNITGDVTVQLPEKTYEKFELDGGVGENTISDLKVNKLDIDGGVGKNSFVNITVLEEADLEFGVGETHMENCILPKSKISVGVGEFDFSGKLQGDTKLNSGVGEVRMNIDGYKGDYDIDFDKGMGDINVNGSERSTTDDKKKLNINSGIGEVNVEFK